MIKTCDIHALEFKEEYGKCPACQMILIDKLQAEVKSWKSAWHHQWECTGKAYWEIPSIGHMLQGDMSPKLIRQLQHVTAITHEAKSVVNNAVYFLHWIMKITAPQAHEICWDCDAYILLHRQDEQHCICGEDWLHDGAGGRCVMASSG